MTGHGRAAGVSLLPWRGAQRKGRKGCAGVQLSRNDPGRFFTKLVVAGLPARKRDWHRHKLHRGSAEKKLSSAFSMWTLWSLWAPWLICLVGIAVSGSAEIHRVPHSCGKMRTNDLRFGALAFSARGVTLRSQRLLPGWW